MDLNVSNISVSLGTKPQKLVLDRVSFCVHDGEFLSLLGASGAGKSTLLKIIAGILIQDAGSITFDSETIDGAPAHKRHVGFVFQDMRLFPHMNVEENIAFPCKMAGMPKHERLTRARTLLKHVHLEGYGKRDTTSLSGGQQQRVALARALAGSPRILLLDEPFSGLDENLRDEMRSLVLRLHKDFDITTIMVTHDAIEALEMSDRIVYIDEGIILQDDTPHDLYKNPATAEVAACFGECSILSGEVRNGIFHRGPFEIAAPQCPDGSATAVIRYQTTSVAPLQGTHLRTKCSIYRGDGYLVRIDIDGQTLTALSSDAVPSTTEVTAICRPEGCFVYPNKIVYPDEKD